MFSGGDSNDGVNSLNQFNAYGFVSQVAVSNAMAAGQNIDWAQLAQQWIQMRDNAVTKTAPATTANKAADANCSDLKYEEKGEADMDMDDEEQTEEKAKERATNDLKTSSDMHNYDQSWFFSESNTQIGPQSTSNNQWNPWTSRENFPNQNSLNDPPTNSTAHIPSLLKITVPHPNEIRVMPDIGHQPDDSNVIDAAKKKGLPAWIREGLEKMERQKLKQLEKVHQNKDINLSDEESNSNKNLVINTFNGPITALEDESSDNEDSVALRANSLRDITAKKNKKEEDDTHSSSEDKSYEQKLTELMIVVRRTLTELLLETTNEEISKVSDETIKIYKSKASSAQVIRQSALSTLTDKLGLAAYGDSSSEDNSDNDESNSSKKVSCQSDSDNDSEEEIRNVIRVKRRAFAKIAEEIEERVASAAAREEEKLKYFVRKEEEERECSRDKQERSLARDVSYGGHNFCKGYEKDSGEITETKIQHPNGKRQKDRSSRRERITRFSDNKDKCVALPNAATFLTNLTATNFGNSSNSITAAAPTCQRQNIPDINGLLPNYSSTGMTNALNAADAALEKALNNEKLSRRQDHDHSYNQSKKRRRVSDSKQSRSRSKSSCSSSSSSSSSSPDTASSTSRSSHHSKYKHKSHKKYKSRASTERQYEKSRRDNRYDSKYSSRSHKKGDRDSTRSRNRRDASSDSEDEYRRRYRNESNYTRNSSQSRSYTSSRRTRDREHSRSQSRSSYSSNNRRQ